MSRVMRWMFPADEQHVVGWFALASVVASAVVSLLVYLQPVIDEQLALRWPGAATPWYVGVTITGALLTYAFVRFGRRRGAPASVWLVPALAAMWTASAPLLDLALYGDASGTDFGARWWNLAPIVVLLAPALIATVRENEPAASLVPAEERRQVMSVALLALSLLLSSKIIFASPRWADAWLPAMSDAEELGYQLLMITIAPFVICLLAVFLFRAPRSAWLVPATATLVPATLVGFSEALASSGLSGLFTYVVVALPPCGTAFLGSALGAWVGARVAGPATAERTTPGSPEP